MPEPRLAAVEQEDERYEATSAAVASGAQDQLGDLPRMRDQRQVPRVELDRLGLHALGEEALKLRRGGAIAFGDGVPGRLRTPGRNRRPVSEQGGGDVPLDGVERPRPASVDAVGEVV